MFIRKTVERIKGASTRNKGVAENEDRVLNEVFVLRYCEPSASSRVA